MKRAMIAGPGRMALIRRMGGAGQSLHNCPAANERIRISRKIRLEDAQT